MSIVCYNIKVQNIYTYNINKKFIKAIVRNLWISAIKKNGHTNIERLKTTRECDIWKLSWEFYIFPPFLAWYFSEDIFIEA